MVAVALMAFFYPRRRGYTAVSKERPVNVLHDEEDGDGSHQDLPHYYAPDPYLVSDPNIGEASGAASTRNRPLPVAPAVIPQTPTSMAAAKAGMRKSSLPAEMRPVNIIQHDDAGPSEVLESVAEHETIELPPAYSNIRSVQHSPGPAPTTASTSTHTKSTTP